MDDSIGTVVKKNQEKRSKKVQKVVYRIIDKKIQVISRIKKVVNNDFLPLYIIKVIL